LLALASTYTSSTKKVAQNPVVKAKSTLHDALPGGNKAVLTLANGKTIILDNAQNGTLAQQGNTLIKKAADGQLIYNVSALAILKLRFY
jgi:transmembrane sensor